MSGHLDYEINKELGECYLFMGELDKAEEYYKKAISSNGIHPDPYLGLATVAVQRGELTDAHTMYKKAHTIEPSDKSLSGLGLIEQENNNLDAAFLHFSNALTMNPENLVAIFSLIRLGHQLDRLSEMTGYLTTYLELDPAKSEVRYSLAGCYVCLKQEDLARTELEKLLELDPSFEAANEMLAQIDS